MTKNTKKALIPSPEYNQFKIIENPLRPISTTKNEKITLGNSIKDCYKFLNPHLKYLCYFNGKKLKTEKHKETKIKKSDTILFSAMLLGSGNDEKDRNKQKVGAKIAGLALIVVGAIYGNPYLIYAGVGLLSWGLITPPEVPTPEQNAQSVQQSNLSAGLNRARLGQAIPVHYGRNKFFPDLITPYYSRYENNEQVVYSLMLIGQGIYEIEGVFLNNTKISYYKGAQYKIIGENDTLDIFQTNVVILEEVNRIVFNDFFEEFIGPFPFTKKISAVEIDVSIPFISTAGANYVIETEVRKINEDGTPNGDWISLGNEAIVSASPYTNKSLLYDLIEFTYYEIQCKATTVGDDKLYWIAAKGITDEKINIPQTITDEAVSKTAWLEGDIFTQDYYDNFKAIIFFNFPNGIWGTRRWRLDAPDGAETGTDGTGAVSLAIQIQYKKWDLDDNLITDWTDINQFFYLLGNRTESIQQYTEFDLEGQGKYQFRFQRINPYPPSYTRAYHDGNNNNIVNVTVNNTIDSWFSDVEQIYVDGDYRIRYWFNESTTDFADFSNLDIKSTVNATNPYPNYTLIESKLIADSQLGSASNLKLNVVFQRKLSQWNPSTGWSIPMLTNSIVWAALDALKNDKYGASIPDEKLDLQAFYDLEQIYQARGDEFCFTFDRAQSFWEALRLICRVGRAEPINENNIYTIIRDHLQTTSSLLLTSRRQLGKNPFTISQVLQHKVDGVTLSFLENQTFKEKSISVTPTGEKPNKPAMLMLSGCPTESQARREALYIARDNAYRRLNLVIETELLGYIPSFGDFITVQLNDPKSGITGDIAGYDERNKAIKVSEPPVFGINDFSSGPFSTGISADGDP